ncbi:MAG TPA: hypothetical protein VM915_17365 [Verrucomicrobiae bacterium]|nr:hypothetical protein [Verrucomicrobiae bacterium]
MSPYARNVMLFAAIYAPLELVRLSVPDMPTWVNDLGWFIASVLVYVVAIVGAGFAFAKASPAWGAVERRRLAARYALVACILGIVLDVTISLVTGGAVFDGFGGAFASFDLSSHGLVIALAILGATLATIATLIVAYLFAHFVLFCISRGLGGTAKPIGGEVA